VKRILFVAEAVTLAQVVRLVTLARALPAGQYALHFASARFDPVVFAGAPQLTQHRIHSRSPAQVERAVAWGSRIYSRRVLSRYVDEDLRLIDRVEPDLVVGDLRWSLLVSAPLRRVPHAALINAYWSPWAVRERFPLPDHPIVKLLGERMAAEYFPRALPFVFRHFARPLDSLRGRHGLAPLGGLLELLTAGDLTLYADPPELIPTQGLPATHHFLGPVQWAPELPLPAWWEQLGGRPSVYVTLGSSGNLAALPHIVSALAQLPVDVMVATAGRVRLERPPANVFVADYLPGDLAARRASVVVCNGGSSTGYQALAEGRPVVGLPWNLDQYLAMSFMERAGTGVLLRATRARPAEVRERVVAALGGAHAAGVQRAQQAMHAHDSAERFRQLVAHVLSPSSSRSSR